MYRDEFCRVTTCYCLTCFTASRSTKPPAAKAAPATQFMARLKPCPTNICPSQSRVLPTLTPTEPASKIVFSQHKTQLADGAPCGSWLQPRHQTVAQLGL